jgi:hypothetical protein
MTITVRRMMFLVPFAVRATKNVKKPKAAAQHMPESELDKIDNSVT